MECYFTFISCLSFLLFVYIFYFIIICFVICHYLLLLFSIYLFLMNLISVFSFIVYFGIFMSLLSLSSSY